MTEVPLASAEIELAKAARLIEAAAHCASGGFHEDAVSRAYYAVFHAGCALLASIGRTVRTHDGLRAMIGEHFIRTGQLAPHFARVLARTAADRNDADYNSVATFTAGDANEALANARAMLDAVEGLLRAPSASGPGEAQ